MIPTKKVVFSLSVTRWWSFLGALCGTSLMKHPTTVRCFSTVRAWIFFWSVCRQVCTHSHCTSTCVFSVTLRKPIAVCRICSIHVRIMLIDYMSCFWTIQTIDSWYFHCQRHPFLSLYDLTPGVSRQAGASPQHVGAFGKCCWGQSTETTAAYPTVHHCIQVRGLLKSVETKFTLKWF